MIHSKHGANIALYNFKTLDLYSPGTNNAPIRIAGAEKIKRTGNNIKKNNIPKIIRDTNSKILLNINCFSLHTDFKLFNKIIPVIFA